MRILSLCAENFRNIERCDIRFSGDTTLFFGKNAQGKTNVTEAIYYFARGKSFRGAQDKDLVRFGEEGFSIALEYEDKNGKNTLEYASFGREKRRIKNGYRMEKASEMLGNFRAVLFSPDDLTLVKDGPEERRNFLSVAISQQDPAYVRYYSLYLHALENRNCLLKFMQKGMYVDEKEFLSWTESMADYAARLYLYRKQYIDDLSVFAGEIMREISDGKEVLSVGYLSGISPESDDRETVRAAYIDRLTSDTEREKAAGVSLYGVHRDDLSLLINGKSARSFGSQGQQRSAVLALKLAEGEVSKKRNGEYPVFLFDDVLSELDSARRAYVLSGTKEKQILITSCEEGEGSVLAGQIIEVTGGHYVSSYR